MSNLFCVLVDKTCCGFSDSLSRSGFLCNSDLMFYLACTQRTFNLENPLLIENDVVMLRRGLFHLGCPLWS